ncbi:SUF system Fe-S cluster assembly protein [Futiania mangrovi]|uniref:SUF system Fe-S cluster assembly protein n=1 Tax=Futiania mangrovi TaxID=2959716 RepID=A0A9J6PGH4_9PROT|nr:SUF system Fe-S cluster assembly protein [Futiania mangrovii]MCP1335703.1 SUF system Fe-S cluster assembly protein [Futiania mangrovii]
MTDAATASTADSDDDEFGGPVISGNVGDHPMGRKVITALRTVYDPEIPVNILDLGLIYRVDIDEANNVEVDMTLTAPGCPVAGEMPGMVSAALDPVEGLGDVKVEIVWDPPWTQDRMSEIARIELGMY